MIASAITPVVPSRDVKESLLGFAVPLSRGEDPVEYGGLSWDGLRLHFYHQPSPQISQNYAFRLQVDEADLCAGIVYPGGKLEDKPWGAREFTVRDPSGVATQIYQELKG